MEFLPRSLGTRPRLACEVRAEGVVAARAEDAFAVLSAVSRVPLADEVVVPRLHAVDANGEVDNSAASAASSGVGGDAADIFRAIEEHGQAFPDALVIFDDRDGNHGR